jgi:hypothetical protein
MTPTTLAAWGPEHWTALATVVAAAVAFAAAVFAGFQVWELRRTREDQSRPFVIVDIQPGPAWANLLDLVVENIGTTAATDVRLTFDPPLKQSRDDGHPLAESSLLRDGIRMLPPGRRMTAFFDTSHERKQSELPMSYEVTVSLSDARGRRQPDQRYTIDFGYLYGLTQVREYGMHDAAKAVTEIQKTIKKWADIHGRLRIWSRDEDRYRLNEVAEEALTGGRPSLATQRPSDLALAIGRNVLVRTVLLRWRTWREGRKGGAGDQP